MAETRAKSAKGGQGKAKSAVRERGPSAAQAPRAPRKKTAVRGKTPRAARSRRAPNLTDLVTAALEDMKATGVRVLDVRGATDIADTMVIASGTSDRHVRSIADRVVERAKDAGFRPMGIEGERDGEWVLVDLQDVIVHVMLPRVREFYRLENLWDVALPRREAVGAAD
jgi:ribosome-associated protein